MTYNDAVVNMHKFLIPLVGSLALIAGSILVFMLARKKENIYRFIPIAYIVSILLQLVFSFFLYITADGWIIGIQLSFTGMIGFYSYLLFDQHWVLVNTIACLYNLLAILGNIPFLGYSSNLYSLLDSSYAQASCAGWFGALSINDGICDGYVSFVRTIAFFLIYVVALQTFLAYTIYREFDELSSVQKSSNVSLFNDNKSSYESISHPGEESDG